MKTLIENFKAARRVSTPLVAITTADPAATISAIMGAMNGAKSTTPLVEWDVIRGLHELNRAGESAIGNLGSQLHETKFNPVTALVLAHELPVDKGAESRGSILFFHMAHRFLTEASVLQAIWNLRDEFKRTGRMLVLLGQSISLPPEIAGDVVALDEPLPDDKQLAEIVREVHAAAGMNCDEVTVTPRAVEALMGLPAFAAEQVTAMSISRDGLDLDGLWDRKRQQIDNTPGLKVYRDGGSLEEIGGVANIKSFIGRVMTGRSRPNAVVFIDEIEKMLAGTGGDTSGVTQDQLGVILSYMQDTAAAGMIFIGPPGSAKSMVAKAAGKLAGVPTIQLDLGGLKGSLVGQSEQQLRTALKVVSAVSNGRSLWIATCNSIAELPPELRRRFTLGTFFFDLPDEEERRAIWKIYLEKYGLARTSNKQPPISMPNDEGWTGAEIKQCCDLAWRLNDSLVEAAQYVVPVSRSAAEQLERLRAQAAGRFLSASKQGMYERSDKKPAEKSSGRRKIEVEA